MRAGCRLLCSFFLGPWLLLPLAGCRNCGELLEAELRNREEELREVHARLERAEAANHALLHELGDLRQGVPLSPETASQTYTLRRIVLARGTGGLDDDQIPGDEALRVVLEPIDSDGHAIKAPGSLHIQVLQITPEGLKTPLSSWDLDPQQLRARWQCGVFSSGYQVILPWKIWPTSEWLRVVARFKLADGRRFETDRDVRIKLPPPPYRPEGAPAAEGEILPMPRLEKGPPKVIREEPTDLGPDKGEIEPAAHWHRPGPGSLKGAVHLLTPVVLREPESKNQTPVVPPGGTP
jgi:hypothetical protein